MIHPALYFRIVVASLACAAVAFSAAAAPAAPPQPAGPAAMTNAGLERLIRRIDPKAEGRPGFWRFGVEGRTVLVITDERADRMRIMTQVAGADKLEPERLYRMLQANFDSALDARYAVAQGVLWSVYLHPLKSLRDADFLSGVGQVVNLAVTYGDSYSSGGLHFGGGDSGQLKRRELIERLLKEGERQI